jgi:2-polyprenyl-6-methoxyphenol hydroxylase-like FAD-dependent oxidoreductase
MGKLQVAPQPSSQPKHIIIAGGGLAGLSTSLGLSKLGYRITIVECRKEWLQQGSAFGLAANGRKALLELFHSPSSMDRLLEKGIHIEQMDSHLMVWYMLRDSLLDEVKECPLIDVKMGTTVESIDDMSDASGVKVVVKNVESGDAEKGCIIISCSRWCVFQYSYFDWFGICKGKCFTHLCIRCQF